MINSKSFFTFIILSSLATFAAAQKLKWGELNKAPKASITPTILGQDEKAIYVSDFIQKKWKVQKFDNRTFKEIYSVEIVLPEINGKKSELEKLAFIQGKIVAFYSGFKKDSDESIIEALFYDAKTGKLSKKGIEILTVPVEKKSRSGSFYVYFSDDRSKMLVEHYAYYKKEERYRDRYILFDNELKVIAKKEEEIEKGEADYSTSNYIIDNEGSYYFLKTTSKSAHIVSYDATKDYEKWEEEVDLEKFKPGSLASGITFTISKENDLLVTGFYEVGTSTSSGIIKDALLKGCFFMKIDFITKEVEKSKLTEFSQAFLDEFKTRKDAKKGRESKAKNKFNRLSIYTKADGGVILTGEEFREDYYYDGNGNLSGYSQLYNNIIALNLDNNGNLIWSKLIPKNQFYYRDYSLSKYFLFLLSIGSYGIVSNGYASHYMDHWSFLTAGDNKQFMIFYNENPKNLEKSTNQDKFKAAQNVKKTVTIKCAIDLKTGEMTREPFFEAKDYSVYLKTTPSYQEEQGSELYIFGQSGKKYRYGRIDF